MQSSSRSKTLRKKENKNAKKATRNATRSVSRSPAGKTAGKAAAPASRHLRSRLKSPVLITAGEHSGDLLGGDLIHEWKKMAPSSFFGTGGDAMRGEGVDLVEHVDNMTVVGFVEVLREYRRLKRLAVSLVALAKERGTRVAVLVDYPGFNLRLASMLKKAIPDIFIVYLVSPQIWAWNYGRIKGIRANVDLMLTLFEFEKRIYQKEGVPAEWIGHPMASRIPEELKRLEPIPVHRGRTLAILPGSRRSEVRHLLPSMLEAARRLSADEPRLRILLPFVNESLREFAQVHLAGTDDLNLQVSTGNSLSVLAAADLVFIASGTATLEAAFFQKPMVICYRSSWLNFLIASAVIRTKFIGLPNLLAGEQVASELLQTEVTPEAIHLEARKLLERKERTRVVGRLASIPFSPKKKRPAVLACEAIFRGIS